MAFMFEKLEVYQKAVDCAERVIQSVGLAEKIEQVSLEQENRRRKPLASSIELCILSGLPAVSCSPDHLFKRIARKA
jgi:hypothetical protein